MQQLQGIAVSPGVAIGESLVMDNEGFRIPRRFVTRNAVDDDIERLDKAIAAAGREISGNRSGKAPPAKLPEGSVELGMVSLMEAVPLKDSSSSTPKASTFEVPKASYLSPEANPSKNTAASEGKGAGPRGSKSLSQPLTPARMTRAATTIRSELLEVIAPLPVEHGHPRHGIA